MGKITRKKLARGTTLVPEHVSEALNQAALEIGTSNVERDQTDAPLGPFYVNISLPYLSHEVKPSGTFTIPFVLPPPQDSFALNTSDLTPSGSSPGYTPTQPQTHLRSVSFSFDQRAEPAAIASHLWQFSGEDIATPTSAPTLVHSGWFGLSTEQGKLVFEDSWRLDIRLSIKEKGQWYFGDEYPHKPAREVWSALIPSTAYAGKHLRVNPFLQDSIDLLIDPYKTYVFEVSCPQLDDTEPSGVVTVPPGLIPRGRFLVLPSVEISMRFTAELMDRDSGPVDVQNIPERGGAGPNIFGAKTAPTVTITTPNPGDPVEADSAAGVEANITNIDDEFVAKFEGGYNKYADTPPTESLANAAAYEVITLPLFQNGAHGGISAHNTFSNTWPYLGSDSTQAGTHNLMSLFDRRIVPVRHSYTIEHVFLAWNWTAWRPLNAFEEGYPGGSGAGILPPLNGAPPPLVSPPAPAQHALIVCPSEHVRLSFGVGIGTGTSSDTFAYQQVAGLDLEDPNNFALNSSALTGWGEGTSLVDRVMSVSDPPIGLIGANPSDALDHWNWEMHSVPLVGPATGAGYTQSPAQQGQPIFMGPGWSNTRDRSNVDGGIPSTEGAEKWLEVRAALYSTDLPFGQLSMAPTPLTSQLRDMSSILVGYGGCYVYIICKKHLTR